MSSRIGVKVGDRFGRIVVIERAYASPVRHARQYKMWRCACDCGNIVDVIESNINKDGGTRSCGCYREDKSRHVHTTHGGTYTKTFISWSSMIERCTNPRHQAYHNYGGRGINVCDSWVGSYEKFLEDMGERPDGMSLDRIDTNKDYEPGNCRWATAKQQKRNTRNNVYITIFGIKILLIEASEFFGVKYSRMYYFKQKYGDDGMIRALKKLCSQNYEAKVICFVKTYNGNQKEGEI